MMSNNLLVQLIFTATNPDGDYLYLLYVSLVFLSKKIIKIKKLMKDSSRLFNCAVCHELVNICSDCDRGNIYCSEFCSMAARKEAQREAGQRYQATIKGRIHHAQRQAAYRRREREKIEEIKKVTHQGSQVGDPNDLLTAVPIVGKNHVVIVEVRESRCCDFCSAGKFQYFRSDFIHHHLAKTAVTISTGSQGP